MKNKNEKNKIVKSAANHLLTWGHTKEVNMVFTKERNPESLKLKIIENK